MNFIDDFEEAAAMEEREAFAVNNDSKAEWAIKKINERRAERDRLVKVCEEQIAEYRMKADAYKEKCERDVEYYIIQLEQYFQTVPHHVTKTMEKYALPSGNLILKQKPPEYKRAETLPEELESKGLDDFIKTKKVEKWDELKKIIQIIDGRAMAVTEDGEAIPLDGVTATPGGTVFEVKA